MTNRYNDNLKSIPEHIPLSRCKKVKMDLSGLLRYAKEKGVQPFELPDSERNSEGMTEQQMLDKLDMARKTATEGKVMDADAVISKMRTKYGL